MRLLLITIIFIINTSAFAQVADPNCNINASLSKDAIVIGDQILYNISVVVPNSYKVSFPSFSDSLIKGIEIVRRPLVEEVKRKDSMKEYLMKTLITSFDSGSYQIPSASIAISNETKTDTLKTLPLNLLVNTVPRDTTVKGFYDIKPPIEEPVTLKEVAPWVFGGLLMVALITLLIIYINRRRHNKPFSFIQKPKDPPHVIALRELDKINHEKLWSSDKHKVYYTRLIDILRVYIEGRFDVNAMEQTTEEILSDLKQTDFDDKDLLSQLDETLSLADLVKFAKYTPVISDNEQSLKFAYDFVSKTKKEVVEIDQTELSEEKQTEQTAEVKSSNDQDFKVLN